MMHTLWFTNPVFNLGRNLTVRRGIKWATRDGEVVSVRGTGDPDREIMQVAISTRVMRFDDLTDDDLTNEHDPQCRWKVSLFETMAAVYSSFSGDEIVTLVEFDSEARITPAHIEVRNRCESVVDLLMDLPASERMSWVQYVLEALDENTDEAQTIAGLRGLTADIQTRIQEGRW